MGNQDVSLQPGYADVNLFILTSVLIPVCVVVVYHVTIFFKQMSTSSSTHCKEFLILCIIAYFDKTTIYF